MGILVEQGDNFIGCTGCRLLKFVGKIPYTFTYSPLMGEHVEQGDNFIRCGRVRHVHVIREKCTLKCKLAEFVMGSVHAINFVWLCISSQ